MTGMTAAGMAKWVITDSIIADAKLCLLVLLEVVVLL